MPKKIIQDIVTQKPTVKSPEAAPAKTDFLNTIENAAKKRGKKYSFKKILKITAFTAFFAASVFFAGFLLTYFSSVAIKVTPFQRFIEINDNFNASRKAIGAAVPFETMTINRVEKYKGKATGVKKISERAKGTIIIYNAFSSRPQLLVKNTRFETPDGKIYRIGKSIKVPGAEIKNGKIVPSAVEAVVYADKPGEQYNIGLSDFTIPGFKGDVRYEKFYARSKTAIKGGFEGIVSVITSDDIAKAKRETEEKIEKYLASAAAKQKPDGFLLYKKALITQISEEPGNPVAGDRMKTFEYSMRGKGTAILIREKDLVKKLVGEKLKSGISGVDIINLNQMDFTLLSVSDDWEEARFNLKGTGHFVWVVDKKSLLSDLKNFTGKNYDSVFSKYPMIEEASIVFKPSWWKMMPARSSNIYYKEILRNQ